MEAKPNFINLSRKSENRGLYAWMFPSQTATEKIDYEEWDTKNHTDYLRMYCEFLNQITEPADLSKPINLTGYFDDAKNTTKLVLEHFAASLLLIKYYRETSEAHAKQPELDLNLLHLKAMCEKGNQRW